MTNQEVYEYLQNILKIANSRECCDVEIDAFHEEAIKQAMNALATIEQTRWERDIAVEQLKELGLSLGQKVDHIKEAITRTVVCPCCKAIAFTKEDTPIWMTKGYCFRCGQLIEWEWR